MTAGANRVLVIGYGNPGRGDDGLGPALAEALEKLAIPGVSVDADYQLTVEDAADAARHEVVVFADAAVTGPEPFEFRLLEPADARVGFSSHSVEPAVVLGMARTLFHAGTRGYVLGIRGYQFEAFEERLSDRARDNLAAAVRFLENFLRQTVTAASAG